MKDFTGKELKIGDKVSFTEIGYRNLRSGHIVKFTKCFVIIEHLDYAGYNSIGTTWQVKQRPNQIVKIDSDDTRVLLYRLKEITSELCSDYPGITTVEPWEQLDALEQSYRGVNAANQDLHVVIEKLRLKCGMTKEEVADLGWPNDITKEDRKTN